MYRKIISCIFLFIIAFNGGNAQQRFVQPENERERKPEPDPIGEFPFNRGETPIFNFDQGDEPFLNTIPDLVKGVYQMVDVVAKQRKITGAFGKGISECEDCKF